MTMVQCNHHGLSFMVPICEHLSDAVVQQQPATPVPLVSPHDEPYLLCKACCADLGIHPQQGRLADSQEKSLFEPHRLACMCEECLAPWLVKHTQFSLEDVVGEAQSRSQAFVNVAPAGPVSRRNRHPHSQRLRPGGRKPRCQQQSGPHRGRQNLSASADW